ncbi:toxin-antitoxin system YwqK family antitoxin [Aequorivita lipolytica]|uniref:Toxin-antitoxin system YwqK family antitoxin n=1 Tax=Aequorivita lipolytica TaxID=153267 RepID=A0A5C6YLF8_9FLAO|nr:hypothetical protein [Aequorivita lipolytica]TXD67811.1 hypothetical protein ESV24_14970 [Aequorivita lipolytica]SRX54160.1 hypothetical protein AEQU2_03064 [Aequorivita lipolytica]
MKKNVIHIIFVLTLISCNGYSQKSKSKLTESAQIEKIDTITKLRTDGTKEFEVQTRNGLKTGSGFLFDRNENIVGLKHFENDTLNGYGLLLYENTFKPNYLYESNNGKRDGVLIAFYENGVIKSFRSADLFNDGQHIEFHENGTIKEIGQTKKGKAHGTVFYFDNNGILKKKVEYENGNIKK